MIWNSHLTGCPIFLYFYLLDLCFFPPHFLPSLAFFSVLVGWPSREGVSFLAHSCVPQWRHPVSSDCWVSSCLSSLHIVCFIHSVFSLRTEFSFLGFLCSCTLRNIGWRKGRAHLRYSMLVFMSGYCVMHWEKGLSLVPLRKYTKVVIISPI